MVTEQARPTGLVTTDAIGSAEHASRRQRTAPRRPVPVPTHVWAKCATCLHKHWADTPCPQPDVTAETPRAVDTKRWSGHTTAGLLMSLKATVRACQCVPRWLLVGAPLALSLCPRPSVCATLAINLTQSFIPANLSSLRGHPNASCMGDTVSFVCESCRRPCLRPPLSCTSLHCPSSFLVLLASRPPRSLSRRLRGLGRFWCKHVFYSPFLRCRRVTRMCRVTRRCRVARV